MTARFSIKIICPNTCAVWGAGIWTTWPYRLLPSGLMLQHATCRFITDAEITGGGVDSLVGIPPGHSGRLPHSFGPLAAAVIPPNAQIMELQVYIMAI